MKAFRTITSKAIPLGIANIDTDIIIPAKYLKITTREGLGSGAFETLRYNDDGGLKSDSLFNLPEYKNAEILIAGDNFGCGSSREHAAWAMQEIGIKVVIAPSYSEIFASNAFKNGILAIVVEQSIIDNLLTIAKNCKLSIDLENQMITSEQQDRIPFEIDPYRKKCLIEGLSEVEMTLLHDSKISIYESKRNFMISNQ